MIWKYAVGTCTYDARRLACRPTDVEFGFVVAVGLWPKETSSHLTTQQRISCVVCQGITPGKWESVENKTKRIISYSHAT
jgi:hypothetical protein